MRMKKRLPELRQCFVNFMFSQGLGQTLFMGLADGKVLFTAFPVGFQRVADFCENTVIIFFIFRSSCSGVVQDTVYRTGFTLH